MTKCVIQESLYILDGETTQRACLQQAWLLLPTLGELIPKDHPARFVAEFVDALDRTAWIELGIGPDGEPLGAPAYHPRALLSVWLYGFMTGIRSSRKLEVACRDQVPYLWSCIGYLTIETRGSNMYVFMYVWGTN